MNWEALVQKIILGTERSGAAGSEAALWQEISRAALRRKAGWKPQVAPEVAYIQAPEEVWQACPQAAMPFLNSLISGHNREAMPEFLAHLAAKKQRFPFQFLPQLLEMGARNTAFFHMIRPYLGKRGAWLAAQNPAWKPLFETSDADWFTGDFSQRKTLLEAMRHADPSTARAWLDATWKEEKPDHLAAFLAIFSIGLSANDGPLLERGLEAKSKPVQRISAHLWALLPENPFQKQLENCWEMHFATAFFSPTQSLDAAYAALDLSADPFPLLARISDEKIGPEGMGRLALSGLLALLSPDFIVQKAGVSAEKVAETCLVKLPDGALSAFLGNVVRREQGAGPWTEAFLAAASKYPDLYFWNSAGWVAFLTQLNETAGDRAFRQFLATASLAQRETALCRALSEREYPWSGGLVTAFFTGLGMALNWGVSLDPWRKALSKGAYCADPDMARLCLDRSLQERVFQGYAIKQDLEAFGETIAFRQAMRRALE